MWLLISVPVLLHLVFVQSIAQKCNVQLILSFVDDDLEVSNTDINSRIKYNMFGIRVKELGKTDVHLWTWLNWSNNRHVCDKTSWT